MARCLKSEESSSFGHVFEISVTLFGLTTVSFSTDSSIRSVSTLLTLSHLEVLPHCCSGVKWMSRTARVQLIHFFPLHHNVCKHLQNPAAMEGNSFLSMKDSLALSFIVSTSAFENRLTNRDAYMFVAL